MRTPAQPDLSARSHPLPAKHPASEQRKVVGVALVAFETLDLFQQQAVEFHRRQQVVGAGEVVQHRFVQKLPGRIAQVGQAVGEGHDDGVAIYAEAADFYLRQRGERTEDGATLIQKAELVVGNEQRRVVARVDVLQTARGGVVFGDEKRDEAVAAGDAVDGGIEVAHEVVQGFAFGNEGVKIGLKIGHEQGRRHAFAADVAYAEDELAVVELHVVKVVATHAELRAINSGQVVVLVGGQ